MPNLHKREVSTSDISRTKTTFIEKDREQTALEQLCVLQLAQNVHTFNNTLHRELQDIDALSEEIKKANSAYDQSIADAQSCITQLWAKVHVLEQQQEQRQLQQKQHQSQTPRQSPRTQSRQSVTPVPKDSLNKLRSSIGRFSRLSQALSTIDSASEEQAPNDESRPTSSIYDPPLRQGSTYDPPAGYDPPKSASTFRAPSSPTKLKSCDASVSDFPTSAGMEFLNNDSFHTFMRSSGSQFSVL